LWTRAPIFSPARTIDAFASPAIVAWRRGVNHLTTKPRDELLSIGRISETPDLDVFGATNETVAALAKR